MTKYEGPKPKVQKNKKMMLVRYGRMGFMGWFSHNESHIPLVNSHVVIKTRRGLELGELIGRFNYRAGQFKNTTEQVDEYFGGKGRDYPLAEGGAFVRFATHEDLMEQKHLEVSAAEEAKCCDKFIRDMNLPMKVVDSEHLFGGERIVIYFTSSGRVDFRDLVRRLAREYQTRIELRQIGSRDEAKLVSDFESCGQECCCRRFLKILEPVNMRMAKLQKATLDPSKISGHCGRLKCCLRYEDETYRELKKTLPRKNALVKTPKGEGKVAAVQILTQLVVVQDASGKRDTFNIEEIEVIGAPNGRSDTGGQDTEDIDDEIVDDNNGIIEDRQQLVDIESEEPSPDDSGRDDSQRPQNGGQDRKNSNRNRNNRRRNRGRNQDGDNRSGPDNQGRTNGA
jgi:cell fate regulator YaaT (PSP1 superfamily)